MAIALSSLLMAAVGTACRPCCAGSAAAVAYGSPQVFRVSMEYSEPPHLSRVTYFRRAVYVCGLFDHWEVLHDLTQSADACDETFGTPVPEEARVVTGDGATWLEIRYSIPVLHTNPRYGTFQVGTKTSVEREPLAEASYGTQSSSHGHEAVEQATGLDVALRRLSSVEEFDDYNTVRESQFASDIALAFELGIIQGKYDEDRRFYDPEALITTGEMLNILARNLGAETTTSGLASVRYLEDLGLAVPGDLESRLSLSDLESLATQIATLEAPGKGDLLVLREAVAGSLVPDHEHGITRAHAVAMFRPATSDIPPSIVRLPEPSQHHPGEWPSLGGQPPSSGTPGPHDPLPDPGGNGTPAPGGTAVDPLFILTD